MNQDKSNQIETLNKQIQLLIKENEKLKQNIKYTKELLKIYKKGFFKQK